MQSVVTWQSPITLEWKNTTGKNNRKQCTSKKKTHRLPLYTKYDVFKLPDRLISRTANNTWRGQRYRKRDVARKKCLRFEYTRRNLSVLLAMSMNLYKKNFKLKGEKNKILAGCWAKDRPEKPSAKRFTRSGEISSPTDIDRQNYWLRHEIWTGRAP